MTVLALIAVLLIEQVRPLDDRSRLAAVPDTLLGALERLLDTGERAHGKAAWLIAVGAAGALTLGMYYVLRELHVLVAWAFNVAVLYLTLGFRQFSHHFTDVHRALIDGDLPRARRLLRAWRGRPADDLNSVEVARLAIEEAFAASHRHVFGVLFWFVVLPGPLGAVLYRLSMTLAARWNAPGKAEGFGEFARSAARVVDWVPLRLTAIGFAVVGNFEDAVYCWRHQAARWRDPGMGIVLAAGAGAIGVKLGKPVREGVTPLGPAIDERTEIGTGEEADAGFLSSTVGLVWRALVLWLMLLVMLAIAQWVS
ncbi:MAG: CobD/CbiB family protein [Burkholderiales bacterium]|nr:CobD/CbiB family protein [Burkholderiales bacterium]